MSEATGEAAVLATLRLATGFSSTNTALANWKLLNTGKDDHYGIVKAGPFTRESSSALGSYDATWSTVVEVWQRYKNDVDSYTSLRTHIDNVIAKFDAYPQLGDVVFDSMITEGGEVEEMWRENSDGPSWLKRDLTVTWQEYTNPTFAG